ncbi:DNA-binding transcriptional regulator, MurR/RpiR family, contains HTH and SIS domains [Nonomuraea solani]|uniref:DNA-binding transcriptional regulator, MurR/RpiR family, contains HTH and SIS domains n=1 Tax=Nonomuraea solani TaxID=1144553 RepID=A0A1H6F0G7_9ACTN|nr:MurR/RpiR family transcriptional regulator [Nonomuraea solani]SEH02605.1 DNA-binding transcriptional regulator, MurR/RpiR family, contains HTH and SIS domains [Nonomuraea solani]
MSTYQPSSGIIERIRGLLPTMPDAQRSLAELVLGDPAAVARMTIVELAERCGVSTGTITRFCRALGMNGYAALRIALASDSGRIGGGTWAAHIGTDVTEGDDIRRVANVISANIGRVVAEAIGNLDLAAVDRAASLLAAARRVMVYGVSGSATTALGFQQRLYQIGVPAWFDTDTHVALAGAALMTRGDVLVVVSHNGRTREVCDLTDEARSHGARTIAVTNDLASPVARRAELALATAVYEMGSSDTENILARHAQLAVLDVLYIAIAQRTFEQTREAIAITTEAVRPYKIDETVDRVD